MTVAPELLEPLYGLPPDLPPAGGLALLDRPAEGVVPSLVTSRGNSHSYRCPEPRFVRQTCDHAAYRLLPVPCDRWACRACRRRRVAELVPELLENARACKKAGQTLKFLTLTWSSKDVAAAADEYGKKRRARDLAHLVQALRRRDLEFEYLKVPELHRSGAVHLHLVVRMPYVRQAELSRLWKRYARGSFRVDIRAATARCPRCRTAGRPGRIVASRRPACSTCGFRISSREAMTRLLRSIAWEIGKYLGKAPAGRVTRSRGWLRAPETETPERPKGFTYKNERLLLPSIRNLVPPGVDLESVVFTPTGSRCSCFKHVAGERDLVFVDPLEHEEYLLKDP